MNGAATRPVYRRKRGQGMTEYIIIIAIVAIGAIAIIGLFGKQIKNAFHRIGKAVSGEAPAAVVVDTAAEVNKQDAMNSFDKDSNKGQE
ncbi:MAG: hypothetical protein WCL44_08115 [bacterium]